ncbi:MAG: hypothetical protein HUU21_17105 [Polyangiaceae bacterium]|nr:hypothetical protein [Polyangiaceae bacterium]NUQ75271.1 hypothetical protein [Polyangiaceae bacterium]
MRTGSALRRTKASQCAFAPALIIAAVLAALAPILWILGVAAHIRPAHIDAAQPGVPDFTWDQPTDRPAYVARARDIRDDCARLVNDRRSGSIEHARAHRLAPCRRAPSHPDRWLAHEIATVNHASWSTVVGAAIASDAIERACAKERRNDILHTSFQRDIHAPRGPPATRTA